MRGESGEPRDVEITFQVETPAGAEELPAALAEAGGEGEQPSDELMYVPIRSCPVRDPFDTELLIASPLGSGDR